MRCTEVCPIRKEAEMPSDREAMCECCKGQSNEAEGVTNSRGPNNKHAYTSVLMCPHG
jgi:hypothetical protein